MRAWSEQIEIHFFSEGQADVDVLYDASKRLKEAILYETGKIEDGAHAEVWIGKVRPFDEVATTWAGLRKLLLRSIILGHSAADDAQDDEFNRELARRR